MKISLFKILFNWAHLQKLTERITNFQWYRLSLWVHMDHTKFVTRNLGRFEISPFHALANLLQFIWLYLQLWLSHDNLLVLRMYQNLIKKKKYLKYFIIRINVYYVWLNLPLNFFFIILFDESQLRQKERRWHIYLLQNISVVFEKMF